MSAHTPCLPPPRPARRRFLARLLGGAVAGALALALTRRRRRELSLREASFYRRHDLAG